MDNSPPIVVNDFLSNIILLYPSTQPLLVTVTSVINNNVTMILSLDWSRGFLVVVLEIETRPV